MRYLHVQSLGQVAVSVNHVVERPVGKSPGRMLTYRTASCKSSEFGPLQHSITLVGPSPKISEGTTKM